MIFMFSYCHLVTGFHGDLLFRNWGLCPLNLIVVPTIPPPQNIFQTAIYHPLKVWRHLLCLWKPGIFKWTLRWFSIDLLIGSPFQKKHNLVVSRKIPAPTWDGAVCKWKQKQNQQNPNLNCLMNYRYQKLRVTHPVDVSSRKWRAPKMTHFSTKVTCGDLAPQYFAFRWSLG